MEKTWRWFGKSDPISLEMLRQIGVEGIVTALHHIPNGEIWSSAEILAQKKYIENSGLHWSVVESLPVSEVIKYGGKERDILIENYQKSLENLGKAGIKTVCYNFMPVIDWIRTDLHYPNADGTQTLYFDKTKFIYFDCHLLKRTNAEQDYTKAELKKMNELAQTITQTEQEQLIDTIIVKTQGFINGNIHEGEQNPVTLFKQLLALYNGIDKTQLRENLRYFLQAIMPICEQYDINMCIHPDDPPFAVLGLPRIVTCTDDIQWILNAIPNLHNGLTFCAGSLSSGLHNDVLAMAQQFADRTKFVHLRSCEVEANGNFREAPHTGGRAHLVNLIRIFEQTNSTLPMRVDHGKLMLDDAEKNYNPGYSFHGRMLALAQVEGMITAINN